MVGDTTMDGPLGFPDSGPAPLEAGEAERAGRARAVKADERVAALQERLANLLKAMADGDERALASLYDETIGKVYGFALRLVNQPAVAEEIAADTYHQAWRHAGRYDATRAKVTTWLLMICRSRALDALRAADPALAHPDPASLAEEPVDAAAPPDLLEGLERRSAVRLALERLSPVHRQLVSLAFFRGLSHQEIADATLLPLGTVKSHLRRALADLREVLPDHTDPKRNLQ